MSTTISKNELIKFQKEWGDNVVNIGKLFLEKQDYKKATNNFVELFYGYREGAVLFKPTRAQHRQFRLDINGAISYFIGGNNEYNEDSGFALQPWTNVRFENTGFIFEDTKAFAMGNYFFTDIDGSEKQVEYSIGVFRTKNGRLKINLHHSSLPYLHPKHETKSSVK